MLQKISLVASAVLFSVATVFGQVGSGKLQGKVFDSGTDEALPFVGLILEQNGTPKGSATTDFDGKYSFASVTPGSYDLKVKFVGYKPKMIQGVVVSANKITFQDVPLDPSDSQVLEEFEVVDYKVPLIDKDGGASGGTVTRDDISKMPGRSATSIATTVGGVYQDAGSQGDISIRGSRSDATYYYIDGIKVRGSTNLPKSSIEEVQVVTGGLPANYGDATGGVISVTTRGPSSFYFGGFDLLSSGFKYGGDELGYGTKVIGLDKYAYNLVEGSVSGPLWMRKDSTGAKSDPVLGFFVSANFISNLDPRPSAIGNWRVRKGVRDSLLDPTLLGPLRPTGTGFGSFYNTDFLHQDAFENVPWRQNAARQRVSAAGKIDVNTGPMINLTFGGQFDYNNFANYQYVNSLFNWENNADVLQTTWRVYGRFTQRFQTSGQEEGEENKSLINNAYYSVMVDYSKFNRREWDPRHEDRLFNYGYVGQFDIYRERSYEFDFENGFPRQVHNGWNDTLVEFTASDVNSSLAALTEQYFTLYDETEGNYENLNQIVAGNALRNGDLPQDVYGLWRNIGRNHTRYQVQDNSQFRITASGSADIGSHSVSLGFEFEQRSDRLFQAGPVGLWTRARQLANNHIRELDTENPMYSQAGTFVRVDYNRLNAAPGEYSGTDAQAFFDYNLRLALDMDPDGTEFINIDALDPNLFTLDMFSADELLNDGNSYVLYYGYDHTGKKTNTSSWEQFFTAQDEFGNFTRPIGAFEPIYMAGYVMDKFAFDDIIFNVGLRVDRFDANQPVLKDPWLLKPAKTVAEVDANTEFGAAHPENMEDDYIVYVNDISNPTAIRGYRRNNGDGTSTWYDSDGVETNDPSIIATGSGIQPYLLGSSDDAVSTDAFEDYTPQITVMPRIAFSFPISDEALFFAHYDVLSKRPTSGNRLDITDYFYMENQNNPFANNPALRPETTIDYELGFQQVLSKKSSLKLSAFYREQRNQVQLVSITQAYPSTYRSWGNIDFGTVKGVTAAYDLRRTGNLWMRASYTLQFAEGTGSSSTSALNLVNSGQPNLRTIYPYSYDQRHAITATIDYRYGSGGDYNGPVLFGKDILQNTGVNIQMNMGSGTPYSAQSNITAEGNINSTQGVLEGQPQGSRKPGQFRMDAQFDRNIELKFGKEDNPKTANLNIYLLVNNVFNTLNVVNVYRATGNPDDDGFLDASQFQNVIEQQNDEVAYRQMYQMKINNPFNYGIPRTIRLGVKVDF